jgi:hypothetical protein
MPLQAAFVVEVEAAGEPGLTAACLAIPGDQNQPGIDVNLAQFAGNWQAREQQSCCWGDGLRLTVLRFPLPIRAGNI